MRISDYKNLIQEMPYEKHSFDIKKSNWLSLNQNNIDKVIFKENDIITINRTDLFNLSGNLKEFILKTLMWGYPSKGRGNNIEQLLNNNSLTQLMDILKIYKNSNVSIEQLGNDIQKVSGLGISTMTKFIYFLKAEINGYRALIIDRQIINVINNERFEDFKSISNIKYENAIKHYAEYLKIINFLAKDIDVQPDKIELFLFTFGRNLFE